MAAVAFDTFKFVNRLEEAGLPRAQVAEALDSTLATKADVARLEASITRLESNTKSDIARVESRIDLLHKDIQSMELRMTVKLGAMLVATAGIIIAALKMLH